MRHLDLFSGIGGFALAARWMGWETVGFCEIEPYCRKILAKNFPGVPIRDDIHELDARGLRVDLVTGGFPCQPHSVAGSRRGRDDARHLWPQFARIIAEARPAWVVIENVPGLRTTAADEVLADLESLGYACWPLVVGAVHVGAPHRRQRVWIVAHADSRRCESERLAEHGAEQCASGREPDRLGESGWRGREDAADSRHDQPQEPEGDDGVTQQRPALRWREQFAAGPGASRRADDGDRSGGTGRAGRSAAENAGDAPYSSVLLAGQLQVDAGPDAAGHRRAAGAGEARGTSKGEESGEALVAIADQSGPQGWDGGLLPERSDERTARPYRPDWSGWTDAPQPAVRRLDDGLPAWVAGCRVPALKALGNAIVPQVAYQLFRAIEECR